MDSDEVRDNRWGPMQIDMHSHVLALAQDPEFNTVYGREGSLCIYRSRGLVPSHRMPTEEEWEASGYSRKGWPVIGAKETIHDHEGFDKIVLLSVSPQYLDGRLIGTVDPWGITDVEGEPHPDKCNDYIAALVRDNPDDLIGFASVNPAHHGPDAAADELERSVRELGLSGLKLYPMYQHWSPDDRELAWPIYEKATELGIPIMFHQAGSTRIDAKLSLGRRPSSTMSVASSATSRSSLLTQESRGRRRRSPPDQASELLCRAVIPDRRPHAARPVPVPAPLRGILRATRETVLRLRLPRVLVRPVGLGEKLLGVNEWAERIGVDPIPDEKLTGIMGDNAARVLGL